MTDTTARADDLKSPAEYQPPTVKDRDTLPAFWWMFPWLAVKELTEYVDHLKATSRGEQASRIEAQGLARIAVDARDEAKDMVLKLVAANEKADADMTNAEARINQLTMFCERAGAERDREKKRVEEITLLVNERDRWVATRDKEIIRLTNLTRNLKRKLSKAEKAAGIKPKKKGGAK